MALDFTTGVLDPRVTFTRGTTATLIDSTGKVAFAPTNLRIYSQEFDNAAWTKGAGLTVTPNAGVAPDGTTTADNLVFSTGGASQFLRGFCPMVVGQTYIYSVYARLVSGSFTFAFDIGNITTGPNETPTSSWQRFSFAFTFVGANQWVDLQASAGGTLQLWGAQLEPVTYQTTPSTYVATTSVEYYGPRFDYDPTTLAPQGLLIEETRTNLLLYSQQFDNAAWSKIKTGTGVLPVVTANFALSPDGTMTADRVQLNAGLNTAADYSIVRQTGTFAFPFTRSIWLKSNTGVPQEITLVAFSAANKVTVPVEWTRITQLQNNVLGTDVFDLCLSGPAGTPATADILVWGAQLESGAFATSYIPTTTTSLTRNADVVSMTGTNFSSWYNATSGAILARSRQSVITDTRPSIYMSDGTANNIISLRGLAANPELYIKATTDQAQIDAGTLTANSSFGLVGAWTTDNCVAAINGEAAVTDTSATIPTVDRMLIGSDGTNYLNGQVERISYWPQRIINAEAQAFSK
jgi:hypothetical protein